MTKAWAFAAMWAVLTLTGCDPSMDGFDPDEAEDEAEDIWHRELVVGDFELSLVTVYTALDGTCTTTRTHTATGNGEYAVGDLAVGIADSEGNEVIGGIGLIGDTFDSEDNAPDDCWGTDADVEMGPNAAGGTLSLRASRQGDPMTLELGAPSSGTIEEVVLDTTVFSADALYDDGAAETMRLQKTVTLPNDGDSGRSAEVTVDLVIDIVAED